MTASSTLQRSGYWITRIRLHHWHEFIDSVIDIPLGVGLHLEGDQGVGKSTILDALQLVLVADERQVQFNASAGEGVDRFVSDYVRCLTPRGFLRDEGIAHILIEFVHFKTHKVITIGVVIEYDGSEKPRKIFLIADAPCELDLVMHKEGEGYTPLDHHDLRKHAQVYASKGIPYTVTEGILDYRHQFSARFGNTPDRFFLIITRLATQEFDGRIDRLIPSLVFEEDKAISGLDGLRQRVLEVRKISRQLKDAESRLEELREIDRHHSEWQQRYLESQQYRACLLEYQIDSSKAKIDQYQQELDRGKEDQNEIQCQRSKLEAEYEQAERKRSDATFNLRSGNSQSEISQLELKQSLVNESLASIEAQSRKHKKSLDDLTNWISKFREVLHFIQAVDQRPTPAFILNIVGSPSTYFSNRQSASDAIRAIRDWLSSIANNIQQDIARNLAETDKKQQELDQITKGRIPDQNAYTVKAYLEKAGLGPIHLLFDLVENVDPQWQGIIEQVVGGRRFTLVTPEDQYQEALRIFRSMNPRDTHNVYLVRPQDVRSSQHFDPTSLAAKITTKNPQVRGLLNIHLRMPADDDEQRAETKSSGVITRSGYSVSGGTDRRQRPLEPNEWVFGLHVREARRDALSKTVEGLKKIGDQLRAQLEDINRLIINTETMARLALDLDPESLEKEIDLRTQLENIAKRMGEIQQAEGFLQLQDAYKQADKYCREIDQQIGKLGERLKSIESAQNTRSSNLKTEQNSLDSLAQQMENLQSVAGWNELYNDLLQRRSLNQTFELEIRQIEREKNNANSQARQSLEIVVNRYVSTRYPNLGFAPIQEKIDFCLSEYRQLEDMEVVKLRAKHSNMVMQADENLLHLFTAKLREQIDLIHTTINELSKTTQGIVFGVRQYRFAAPKPNPSHPSLIRDVLNMLEDYSKKNEVFVADILELLRRDWGDTLERLYRVLVPDDLNLTTDEQLARSIILYPVRYFIYDLQFREHKSEQWHDMSKSISKGSGGERQSPYYVVVIAAMMHVYNNHPDRPRLIILDEAFAKAPVSALSGLGLVNEVGLQPIVATPLGSVAAEQAIGYTLRLYKPAEGRRFLLDETKEAYRRAGLSRENFFGKSSATTN